MENFTYKRVSKFDNFDDKRGIIKGYASVYNIIDRQNDIVRMGAFNKTVTERGRKIKIFKNHQSILVGVPVELDINDSYGLGITAKMLMETDAGRDTYHELKFLFDNGFEAGFSVGGWIIKRNPGNKSEIQEFKLKEISVLTTEEPANNLSVVDSIKSIREMDSITQSEFWDMVTKAYDENFSDNTLKSLESYLSLKDVEPDETSTLIQEPAKVIKSIYELYI